MPGMSDCQHTCRVCQNTQGNEEYMAREMLLGTRLEYDYFRCGDCGCLQLADIPDDLSQFYPPEYCAFKDYSKRTRNVVRRVFDSWLASASLPEEGVVAKSMLKFRPPLEYLSWAQTAGVDKESRILDVGCGAGKLLTKMTMAGFRNLKGIDPFISDDIRIGSTHIEKISTRDFIDASPGQYDLVMLHHAFEHVPDPYATLHEMQELMTDDGYLLIRIPVADCYSREKYGRNWYSWDAPRHTYLHTMKSMQHLAEKTGLVIRHVKHDATFHQLQNSELYAQNIPGNQHTADVKQRFSP